jgi:hypothetical protein
MLQPVSILLLVILPVISLATGVLSLYVDPKSDPRKKRTLILVLALSALATAATSMRDQKTHQNESDALRDDLKTTKELVSATRDSTEGVRSMMTKLVAMLTGTYGYDRSKVNVQDLSVENMALVEKSVVADKALQRLPALPSVNAGLRPVVRYFAKDLDPKVVREALNKEGFSVDVRAPLDTKATNVIWIGDGITPEEAHTVALVLVRAGVQLNAILRFAIGGGAKAKLIEVGAHEGYRSSKFLSVEEIQTMKEFPRDEL